LRGGDAQKSIIVLANGDTLLFEFLRREVVAVQVGGAVKRKKEAGRITMGSNPSSRRKK